MSDSVFKTLETSDKKDPHKLFHEAQRRASRRQRVTKHSTIKGLLLSAPNNIIFDLFDTIVKEWPSQKLFEFTTSYIREYLQLNWSNKITKQIIKRLYREQALDSKAGLTGIPMIRSRALKSTDSRENHKLESPARSGSSSPSGQRSPPIDKRAPKNRELAIDQIYEHIMWRVRTNNVTQITSLLVKIVIDDGYKRGKLKSETYDDVATSFEDWRANKLIKLYSFGNAPANDQKLILGSTTSGDLTKWVANFIDGTEKKTNSDLIRKLATALRDKTKNCIYLTDNLEDALRAFETGALRCTLVVDRDNIYDSFTSVPNFSTKFEPLILSGKIYVVNSLDCIEFAPDPTTPICC